MMETKKVIPSGIEQAFDKKSSVPTDMKMTDLKMNLIGFANIIVLA